MKTLKICWFPLIMFVLAVFAAGLSHAGEARVSWSAPTERTDGTPLTNLAGYRVLWGTAPRNYVQSAVVMHPTTPYTVTDLPEGTHYFAVTAFDANDLESAYSAEVSKTIEAPPPAIPPAPPGGLTVQDTARAAYSFQNTIDRIALVPVGMVPAGTPCDGSQAVRDSNGVTGYVVPKSAVAWAGSVRSEVVVAACQ